MGLFSSYKAVNDEEVFRAVMYSCMAMKNVPGAQYFMHKGKLVIAYNWDNQQKENVPDDILHKTGYVSLYHPENSRE